jgi:hypothetical protein
MFKAYGHTINYILADVMEDKWGQTTLNMTNFWGQSKNSNI